MLDYTSLAAVAAVVREGSFERAARVLNVTTSAISQRVKHLEERLGSVLIVRGQPCTATDTGRMICSHVEQVGLLEHELRGSLPKLARVGEQDDKVTLRVAVNADSLGTWFVGALEQFVAGESANALVNIALDNEEHTVEWLRAGDVLAAVTAHAQPVQGFNSLPLGRLTYLAVASPGFVKRYFPDGVTAATLSAAPSLKFNHKDRTQGQWVRRVFRREVEMPSHWFPATQAFLDASLAGIGWGMNPEQLVREHLESGALVELVPRRPLPVPLYWQHTRLQVPMLGRLTRAVVEAARETLT
jgi:LysR family transcriptional regulator (chromosome initiation inhibitor)